MLKRIITAVLSIPLVMLAIWQDNPFITMGLLLVTSLVLSYEILSLSPRKPGAATFLCTQLGITLLYLLKYLVYFKGFTAITLSQGVLLIFFAIFFIISTIYAFRSSFDCYFDNVLFSVFSFFYAGLIFSLAVELRFLHALIPGGDLQKTAFSGLSVPAGSKVGALYFFYIMSICWMYDSGGYFVGRKLGNKKLGLSSSPNKSWAGFIGGLVFAIITFLLFDLLAMRLSPESYSLTILAKSLPYGILITLLLALFSQAGDLVESVMKRCAGKKDSGTIIFGHGGIFDAIDSIIIGLVAFYLYLTMIHPLIFG